MTQEVLQLSAALREELQHHGEMLALLEQQRQGVESRTAEPALHATAAIQRQARAVVEARTASDSRRRALARELRQEETATALQLAPLVPPHFRPLVQTLVEENDALFQSVRQAARGNHLLLSRSLTSMQQFLELLFPGELPVAP